MTNRSFFDNRYADFNEDKRSLYVDRDARYVNTKTCQWIKHQLDGHLHQLQSWLDQCVRSPNIDYTVYSGCAGFTLLYLNMCESPINYSRLLLQKSMNMLEAQLSSLSGRNFSFLTGDCGPLAIAAVLFMRHGEKKKAIALMEQMKQFAGIVCDPTRHDITDDLGTGRAGYLFSLLFVYTQVEWQPVITTDLIRRVCEAIVRGGQERAGRTSGMTSAGLCFTSIDSPVDPFIGVLYGQAGVLHTLMMASQICAFEDFDFVLKNALQFLITKNANRKYYPLTLGISISSPPKSPPKTGINYPTTLVPAMLPMSTGATSPASTAFSIPKEISGNVDSKTAVLQRKPKETLTPTILTPPISIDITGKMSSPLNIGRPNVLQQNTWVSLGPLKAFGNTSGSTEDLNQWCNGSAGLSMLFCTASTYFYYDRKVAETFLKEATSLAEIVWDKGLSVKGYGLCHGAAGSAYAMLRMYQVTRREVYLHRAIKFAEHCMDYSKHNLAKATDYTSLFEGT